MFIAAIANLKEQLVIFSSGPNKDFIQAGYKTWRNSTEFKIKSYIDGGISLPLSP